VELSAKQLELVKVEAVGEQDFTQEKIAIGNIDFNEDRSVQVFTPYQGKIISAFGQLGQAVHKGQPLYTVQSPDLLQAESTLIAAAGLLDLDNRALARAQKLYPEQGFAQKDLEQAKSDQMTAEVALKAARQAVLVFGKSEAEIDSMVARRQLDPVLIVPSPISGMITARNAQVGLLVQPGETPAPYVVSDTSTMWMLADATEADSAAFHRGDRVEVTVMALPGRVFDGRISTIGASLDPSVHTLQMRAEVRDPEHLLRSGMLANFVIQTGESRGGAALSEEGVVREPDGTMTAWVTTDRRHFTQRKLTIGTSHDGYDQVLAGVRPGELAVTKGAVFLDNMLNASPED
jgi:cobalt-zinc-cadmium efflux system membrane fusion protein